MLAPFTAGWQMKAGVPLVIERGEVCLCRLTLEYASGIEATILHLGDVKRHDDGF